MSMPSGRRVERQPGVRTTLPMLRRSARKRWASPALLKGKTFATIGANFPPSRSLSSGLSGGSDLVVDRA
jgi:hypothetical protein